MKIGIIFSNQTGGGQTFISEILRALSERAGSVNHSFSILAPSIESLADIPDPFTGLLKISLLARPAKPVASFRSRLGRVLGLSTNRNMNSSVVEKSQPYDQCSYDQFIDFQGLEAIWFLDQRYQNLPDLPYFATIWDLQHRLQPFFPEVEQNGTWEYREQGLSRYLQRAAMVITGSQTGKAEVERYYQVPPERIRVIGYPTPKFEHAVQNTDAVDVLQRHGLQPGYLFYPAQFWPHKNHINLLHALQILRQEHGLVLHAVFVGKDLGNESHVRNCIAELNLGDQVHILGYVPRADLLILYKSALALCFLTFFGPDNIPPLEAFSLGCPVIASDVSGAREQLGADALLVDPKDPQKIALAILSLQADPALRQQLIQRGLAHQGVTSGSDYLTSMLAIFDEFASIRRCWK